MLSMSTLLPRAKNTAILVTACLVAACTAKSPMDTYIDNVMSRLTLEQKIGQLNLHSTPGFISADDLSYYNHDLQWVCEPGDFEIMTGPNSRETQAAVLRVL